VRYKPSNGQKTLKKQWFMEELLREIQAYNAKLPGMEYFMFMNKIEIGQIDLRFEKCRLKDKNQEEALLTSILNQGVRDPLQCVCSSGEHFILLDGFKRLQQFPEHAKK
jgi:hypothetical protein